MTGGPRTPGVRHQVRLTTEAGERTDSMTEARIAAIAMTATTYQHVTLAPGGVLTEVTAGGTAMKRWRLA